MYDFLQPLRQKSKIFDTSPYTGEAFCVLSNVLHIDLAEAGTGLEIDHAPGLRVRMAGDIEGREGAIRVIKEALNNYIENFCK